MKTIPRRFRAIIVTAICWAWLSPVLGHAEEKPEFRPALVGNGSKSLVNLIDTAKLRAQGQGDAVLFFEIIVLPWNRPTHGAGAAFPTSPDSKFLRKEVLKEIDQAVFIPAIANYKETAVVFRGTVVFFAGKEKPHLQIYANQDRAEIAQGNDFIAPQLLFGTENWDSVDAELAVARNHLKNGMVELAFHVDATGKVLHSSVVHEYPPGLNFGDAGLKAFAKARFIPGFRNGKPFECTFQLTEFYHPRLVFVPRYR